MDDNINVGGSSRRSASPGPVKSSDDQQAFIVEQLGYTPVYRRALRSIGIIGLSISLASPMSAFFIVAWYQVYYAGYWGLTWGWLIPCILMLPSALASAELASSMPVNGANYWYSAALAAPKHARILAFIVGWVNVASLITAVASFVFAITQSFVVVITILNANFAPNGPQLMGIAYGITAIWGVLSFTKIEHMNWLFITTGAITCMTSIIYIVGLPVSIAAQDLGFASGSDVFASYTNYSDWPLGVSVPFSWFSVLWSVTGWQSAAYVAGETHDATRQVPKAIVNSFLLMSGIGLVVCTVTAFCVKDMDAFANEPSGFPVYSLMATVWGSPLAFTFTLAIWLTVLFGGSGTMITSATQISAFARDGGLPYSHIFAYVHASSNNPIYSQLLLIVGCLLLLLFSLSAEASTIIYSLSVVTGLITLSIPQALRCVAGTRWVPGAFNLGKFSIPVHASAVITSLYFCIINCFPTEPLVDASNFNWNWVFSIGVALVIAGVWFTVGKTTFKGLDTEALLQRQQEYHDILVGVPPEAVKGYTPGVGSKPSRDNIK